MMMLLDVRVTRIFLWSAFYISSLGESALAVYGDRMQTRSFCYISDTSIGLLLLLANEGVRGEVVNVGNPEGVTILRARARRIVRKPRRWRPRDNR